MQHVSTQAYCNPRRLLSAHFCSIFHRPVARLASQVSHIPAADFIVFPGVREDGIWRQVCVAGVLESQRMDIKEPHPAVTGPS